MPGPLGIGGGGGGTVTSVAALTVGTTGTDLASSVATGTTTPVITLNVPTASATNRGALSATDWSTFNGKTTLASAVAATNTWAGTQTFSNATYSALFTGGNVGIATTSPIARLDARGTNSKTTGSRDTAAFFGSNDASNPLGLSIGYSYLGSRSHVDLLSTVYGTSGNDLDLNVNDGAGGMTVVYQGNVGVNQRVPGSTLDVKGTLRLSGSTSGYVGFSPAAAAGSTTYTLPTADGTNGQMLSTNGTATLSWATPAAGSITQVTFAESTASPNTTVYVDSMTAAGTTADVDLALVTKGGGAILRQVPDGTITGGDKRGLNAVDFQSATRTLSTAVASGARSTILNGSGTATASGSDSLVLNQSAKAVGNSSIAGQQGTATPNYSISVGASGTGAAGGGTYAINFGGLQNGNVFAAGIQSSAYGGATNHATGTLATVLGGQGNKAGGYASVACGLYALTSVQGQFAFGSSTSTFPSQLSVWQLRNTTVGAVSAVLTSDAGAAGTTNQVVMADTQAVMLDVLVLGNNGGTAVFGRKFTVLLRRGTGVATTAIVAQTTDSSMGDASLSACTVVLTADTTNGGLAITATGIAATTIRWHASCRAVHGG